jgi:hypothetical protein
LKLNADKICFAPDYQTRAAQRITIDGKVKGMGA